MKTGAFAAKVAELEGGLLLEMGRPSPGGREKNEDFDKYDPD